METIIITTIVMLVIIIIIIVVVVVVVVVVVITFGMTHRQHSYAIILVINLFRHEYSLKTRLGQEVRRRLSNRF